MQSVQRDFGHLIWYAVSVDTGDDLVVSDQLLNA